MRNSSRTPCPDRDLFARVFMGDVGADEREAFIDHILDCRTCEMQFDVLRQVGKEFRKQEAGFARLARQSLRELTTQKKAARPGRVWAGPARMAAGLLVMAGLLVAAYFVLFPPAQTEVLRSGEMPGLRLIEPKGRISGVPAVFKWTPVQKADSYTFALTDDDLQTIVRRDEIRQNSFDLPSDLRQQMVRGKPYVWSITAYDDLNLKIDSGQQDFEIE
jgi:hypothetical protein